MKKTNDRLTGAMQSFRTASGLDIRIADFVSSETITRRFKSAIPVIRFYFHLSGRGYWDLRLSQFGRTESRLIQSDRLSSVLFYPEMEGKIYLPEKYRQYHLSICIAPSRLSAYLGNRLGSLPKGLRTISEGSRKKCYVHTGPLSRLMHHTIRQLLDCPYTGSLQELYLETKAVELIVHKLAQTIPEAGRRDDKPSRSETERLWYARELLCRDLEKPPGLFALARAVGTNHCQLNAGFRKLFGTTVFDYLRQKRLVEARRMIEEDGMNVTEAALRVGYNSISSFSQAFTKHFGMQPVTLRQRRG